MRSTDRQQLEKSPLSEKSPIFRRFIPNFNRFFPIRFFHYYFFSRPADFRFFSEKSANFGEILFPGREVDKRRIARAVNNIGFEDLKAQVSAFLFPSLSFPISVYKDSFTPCLQSFVAFSEMWSQINNCRCAKKKVVKLGEKVKESKNLAVAATEFFEIEVRKLKKELETESHLLFEVTRSCWSRRRFLKSFERKGKRPWRSFMPGSPATMRRS